LIENNGFGVAHIHRGTATALSENAYRQHFAPIQLGDIDKQITILDGDIIFDQQLRDWLSVHRLFSFVAARIVVSRKTH